MSLFVQQPIQDQDFGFVEPPVAPTFIKPESFNQTDIQDLSQEKDKSVGAPLRLRIEGSKMIDPTTGKNWRPTGFNWPMKYIYENEGKIMKDILPGANVARILGMLWDNTPQNPNLDCMQDTAPYWKESCFRKLDQNIKRATDNGVWVILTGRAQIGAGQNWYVNPNENMFHNMELRKKFFTAWQHVVERYKSWDRIAAYEILSEPRDQGVSAQVTQQFYVEGAQAIRQIDSVTPLIVGPRSYYKLYAFTDEMYMDMPNIIYTFDYFNPDRFVFGQSQVPNYPGTYPCGELYKGWVPQACPNGDRNLQMKFDADWHENNFKKWVVSFRDKHNVPVFMNQWNVIHGKTEDQGRLRFMEDVAKLCQKYNIGWAWWTWRGGNPHGPFKNGSSNWIYRADDGSTFKDEKATDMIKPYMSDQDPDYSDDMSLY